MKRDLRFEIVYTHPPERVWRALTDPAAIAQWLMPNNFEAKLGHKFEFRTTPRGSWDGVVQCEILELDPPRRLAYSWAGGGISTRVTFALEPVPQGTRLRLEHAGFRGIKGMMLSFILGSGWKSNILRKLLPAVLPYANEQGFHLPPGVTLPGCEKH